MMEGLSQLYQEPSPLPPNLAFLLSIPQHVTQEATSVPDSLNLLLIFQALKNFNVTYHPGKDWIISH